MSGNSLIEKIGRPLDHPPDYHLDISPGGDRASVRVYIPKDTVDNLRWRRAILQRCEGNLAAQRTQMTLCASPTPEGCLYWLNAFGWTYLQMKMKGDRNVAVMDDGSEVPFIPWPVQDAIVRELIDAILTGKNAVVDKTRDMGMSWLILAVFVWMFLFIRNVNFMVMSRVEELVWNGEEDPDTLLWKVDFLISKCPEWMRPPNHGKGGTMRRFNPRTRSSIVGKSTNAQQGRAGRKTAVLLDEAAAMLSLKSIWISMSHSTACIIGNSTPLGPGFWAKLVRKPKGKLIRAPFWDHPDKGRGRYERVNPETQEIEIRSPWLDRLEEEADDPMVVSQEVLMDHQGAGYIVFPPKAIQRQELHCRPPLHVGRIEHVGKRLRDLDIRERRVSAFDFIDDPNGPLKLWVDLEEDEYGQWRPPQMRTYGLGCDVSWGQGRSNSTGFGEDYETGEQVLAWADARTGPEEFARQMAMLGLWLGGARKAAFLIWEDNGGGGTFRIAIRKLTYPWMYFNIDERKRKRTRTDRYGWTSNDQAKKDLLGHLAASWGRDDQIVRDEACVREAGDYIFYDSGGVGPGELAQESPVATKTHGDRVIGAMLADYGRGMAHRCNPPDRVAPPGSPADRRERAGRRALRVDDRLPGVRGGRVVIPHGFTRSRMFG